MTAPITFVDVETTGLTHGDRVVSLGLIFLPDLANLSQAPFEVSATHLVFNPGIKSHPRARAVHGYDDDTLSRQDTFAEHADTLRPFFDHDGPIVAHNASFDRRFIENEFRRCTAGAIDRDYFCTMLTHRRRYGSKSGLDAVLQQMGKSARKGHHGAFVDAWHAMQIYAWLHDLPVPEDPDTLIQPTNYRSVASKTTKPLTALASVEQPKSAAFGDALNALLPVATMMLFVARADSDLADNEVDSISLFVQNRLSNLGLQLSQVEQGALLATLCADTPGEAELELASARILDSAIDRAEIAGWLRQVTFSDGSASEAERLALLKITQAAQRAKSGPLGEI